MVREFLSVVCFFDVELLSSELEHAGLFVKTSEELSAVEVTGRTVGMLSEAISATLSVGTILSEATVAERLVETSLGISPEMLYKTSSEAIVTSATVLGKSVEAIATASQFLTIVPELSEAIYENHSDGTDAGSSLA